MIALSRLSAFVVIGILAVIAIAAGVFALGAWTLEDMDTYLSAAGRLRAGEALYSTTNPLAAYQYAPWFAVTWIPLSMLPTTIVAVLWSAVLIAASFLSVVPLARHGGMAAIAIMLMMLPVLLFSSARSGNVQPLIVAMLVFGLERRWGPLAIALAASLKAFPILLAVIYLGRGEWRRLAVTLLLTAVLVAPMLLFELDLYTADGPRPGTLFAISPLLWALPLLALLAVAGWLARRGSPHAWLAGATSVVFGLPRMLSYDVTFLLAALPARANRPVEDER